MTALSPAQLTRLVARHAETGAVVDLRARNSGRPFETRYGPIDIRLLAEVDEAFGQMSGLATCEMLRRAFEVHGDRRFERLASISRSHVYNLRGSRTYRAKRTTWTKTKGLNVAIAVRKAPEPSSVPGFLRVDTVHQGDLRPRPWTGRGKRYISRRPTEEALLKRRRPPKHHLAASRPPRRIEPQPPPRQTRP